MDRDEARKILGLPSNFTKHELREAYLRQVRVHHPDLKGDANSATMGQINAARTMLSKMPTPSYGIAGEELWSDLQNWREVAQSAEKSSAQSPEPVGIIGRLTRRGRARSK